MTQLAILRTPGDFVVMTHTAEPAFNDVCHENVVGACAHLESDFGMTHPATEADAMEPVREDHRAHASLFRTLVDYYISVFGSGGKRGKQHEQCQQDHGSLQKPTCRASNVRVLVGGHLCISSSVTGFFRSVRLTLWQ